MHGAVGRSGCYGYDLRRVTRVHLSGREALHVLCFRTGACTGWLGVKVSCMMAPVGRLAATKVDW